VVAVRGSSCIVIGQVAAAIVDGCFSGDRETGWRWMLGLGGVPSAVQLVGLYFLPESPRWLISNGREAEARTVLRKLRRVSTPANASSSSSSSSSAAAADPSSPSNEAAGRAGSSSSTADVDAAVDAEIDEIVHSLALAGQRVRLPRTNGDGGGTLGEGTTAPSTGPADASSEATLPPEESAGGVTLAQLWQVRRQLTLGVGLLVLQQMIGINTIMYYSVSILLQAHVGTVQQSIWLAVPVASAQLVGCIIGGLAIDRLGRRPLVLASLIGATISLGLEGSVFLLDGALCNSTDASADAALPDAPMADGNLLVGGDGPLSAQQGGGGSGALAALCAAKGYVTVAGMVVYLLCFGIGMSPVPWAVNAEIYPMRVRGACMGIATASNWVMNFIVAATFLTLQDAVGKPGAFWIYGGVAALGAVWLCISMPETSGRSLEQIEALFKGRRVVQVGVISGAAVRPEMLS
jgi:MFS family permease